MEKVSLGTFALYKMRALLKSRNINLVISEKTSVSKNNQKKILEKKEKKLTPSKA